MAYKTPALSYFEWQQPVLDKDLVDPPGGETKGDRYLINGVGINAWAGEDGNIATYNGAGWNFTDKKEGMFVYVMDENLVYLYIAAWAVYAPGGATDKIEEGNSSVEVIDAGVGYIETIADAQQVRKDAVLGNIQPLQPAFFAYNTVTDLNETGDGTIFTLDCNTELYDQGGNYANPTFTAPITGKYFVTYGIEISGILAANANFYVRISTSNRDYRPAYGDSYRMAEGTGGNMAISGTMVVDLDINDTCTVAVAVQDGLKVCDIIGHVNDPKTYFSMTLLV